MLPEQFKPKELKLLVPKELSRNGLSVGTLEEVPGLSDVSAEASSTNFALFISWLQDGRGAK
jgi:hypothetical protein